jgi:hypothetical protein
VGWGQMDQILKSQHLDRKKLESHGPPCGPIISSQGNAKVVSQKVKCTAH